MTMIRSDSWIVAMTLTLSGAQVFASTITSVNLPNEPQMSAPSNHWAYVSQVIDVNDGGDSTGQLTVELTEISPMANGNYKYVTSSNFKLIGNVTNHDNFTDHPSPAIGIDVDEWTTLTLELAGPDANALAAIGIAIDMATSSKNIPRLTPFNGFQNGELKKAPGIPVPLPAAVWMGGSLLGILAVAKNVRHRA